MLRTVAKHLPTGLIVCTLIVVNSCASVPTDGPAITEGDPVEMSAQPRSAVVALAFGEDRGVGANTMTEFVRTLTERYADDDLPDGMDFPLRNAVTDSVRAISGTRRNVVLKWLDPIGGSSSIPFFGANADFIAYFGDDWDRDWNNGRPGSSPLTSGNSTAGWLWVNHESLSNITPGPKTQATGQHATLAEWVHMSGFTRSPGNTSRWNADDLNTYLGMAKYQIGASWFRVARDAESGMWKIDPFANAVRYDATSSTLASVTGMRNVQEYTDFGTELPHGVVPGTLANCSGAITPWGTVMSCEENSQEYYGDYEDAWSADGDFEPTDGFKVGRFLTFGKGGAGKGLFGAMSTPGERHLPESYGFVVEFDPGQPANAYYRSAEQGGNGSGHRKLGALGRARWENVCFVTDDKGRLEDGKPIVMYGGDDRPGGRIFKFVSKEAYQSSMTRAQVRALLDDGKVYVAHFANLDNATGNTLKGNVRPTDPSVGKPGEIAPGRGLWIQLGLDNESDIAPNAGAMQAPGTTVRDALRDVRWNGMGGFASDDDVRRALYTACNKIGIRELNRPEDIEYCPNAQLADGSRGRLLYVAFTGHTKRTALDENGLLWGWDPASEKFDASANASAEGSKATARKDKTGSIFAIREMEDDSPATSMRFTFWGMWYGSEDKGPFDAACPDNLMVDAHGGLWFGTDGNVKVNGTADGLYYLDTNPAHGASDKRNQGYLKAFRIAACPSDAECTGPALTPDMKTIFFSVQHPGEEFEKHKTSWPSGSR